MSVCYNAKLVRGFPVSTKEMNLLEASDYDKWIIHSDTYTLDLDSEPIMLGFEFLTTDAGNIVNLDYTNYTEAKEDELMKICEKYVFDPNRISTYMMCQID